MFHALDVVVARGCHVLLVLVQFRGRGSSKIEPHKRRFRAFVHVMFLGDPQEMHFKQKIKTAEETRYLRLFFSRLSLKTQTHICYKYLFCCVCVGTHVFVCACVCTYLCVCVRTHVLVCVWFHWDRWKKRLDSDQKQEMQEVDHLWPLLLFWRPVWLWPATW